jgi:hypothetical protein
LHLCIFEQPVHKDFFNNLLGSEMVFLLCNVQAL